MTAFALVLAVLTNGPPFAGTVFIEPDVITAADATTLQSVEYSGRGEREVFDRRVGSWATVEVFLFDVQYSGRPGVEYQVNLEFGSPEAARVEVDAYAPALGQLPAVLLERVADVEIHGGDELAGGNGHTGTIHIHTEKGEEYIRDGFLEEVLFHEGAHVSLDLAHSHTPGWRAAQEADVGFISEYARDNPDREDMAESVLPYFAVRYRPERLTARDRVVIEQTIPNRLEYFDSQALDWSPYMADRPPGANRPPTAVGTLPDRELSLRGTLSVDASGAFVDPDGDPLTYTVSSSAPDVVTVRSAAARVTLTAVSAGTATIRVAATDPGGLSATQVFTATVATVRVLFTDDPLVPGVTPVKAVHFAELRERINGARAVSGLGRFEWTDPVLRAGVTRVSFVHLLELRQALAEAYAAAGRAVPRWRNASPTAGAIPIRAAHVTELRAAVLALE